jgi:antitoxin (DNA-binding transcriptional repressor) of toxin-antitoxin stability system
MIEAVERGEQFAIARGERIVARLLPAEGRSALQEEREEWARLGMASLERGYGPDEPDYSAARILEANPAYRP